MIADDDPRLSVPGPPNGERYLCPLTAGDGPCSWYLDVPSPEVEPMRADPARNAYVLAVSEVPIAAIEARILDHLRHDHDPAEVWSRLLQYLDGR